MTVVGSGAGTDCAVAAPAITAGLKPLLCDSGAEPKAAGRDDSIAAGLAGSIGSRTLRIDDRHPTIGRGGAVGADEPPQDAGGVFGGQRPGGRKDQHGHDS